MAKIIKESTAISLILTLLFQNVFFSDHKAFNTINSIIISGIMTFIIIAKYLELFNFPKNKKHYFKYQYNMG